MANRDFSDDGEIVDLTNSSGDAMPYDDDHRLSPEARDLLDRAAMAETRGDRLGPLALDLLQRARLCELRQLANEAVSKGTIPRSE